jgi:hypothetical protein
MCVYETGREDSAVKFQFFALNELSAGVFHAANKSVSVYANDAKFEWRR